MCSLLKKRVELCVGRGRKTLEKPLEDAQRASWLQHRRNIAENFLEARQLGHSRNEMMDGCLDVRVRFPFLILVTHLLVDPAANVDLTTEMMQPIH